MKKKMGIYHSSLNCDRLSRSIRNCFGIESSANSAYQEAPEKRSEVSDSAFCSTDSLNGSIETADKISKSQRSTSRKSRSSRECCCCRGSKAEDDGYSYNICSHPARSQMNPSDINLFSGSSLSSFQRSNSKASSVCTRERKSTASLSSAVKPVAESTHGLTKDQSAVDYKLKRTTVLRDDEGGVSTNISSSTAQKGHFKTDSKGEVSESIHGKMNGESESFITSVDGILPQIIKQTTDGERQSVTARNSTPNSSETADIPEKAAADVEHFRNLISMESIRLNQCIESWSDVLWVANTGCPPDVCDEIRTVIGQTRLVIAERFTQFTKLIDRADGIHVSDTDTRPVLLSDLQGFWDLIYFQVEDVDSKFNRLTKLRLNQWKIDKVFETDASKTDTAIPKKTKQTQSTKKNPARKKKTLSSEEDKKRREAARKRLAEARKALAQRNQVHGDSSIAVKEQPQNEAETPSTNPTFTVDVEIGESKNAARTLKNNETDNAVSRKRPESIVDAIACSVAVNHVNADATSLSSVSSTSLVR